jgi:hypothetical protein
LEHHFGGVIVLIISEIIEIVNRLSDLLFVGEGFLEGIEWGFELDRGLGDRA